jgi:hypothetical protein
MLMTSKRIACAVGLTRAALGAGSATADVPTSCNRHLSVELTPDVPNPRELAFLSSLLTQPLFQRAGRGQDDQCSAAVVAMRRDTP